MTTNILGPGLVDGPTLFLIYRVATLLALVVWFVLLSWGYVHPRSLVRALRLEQNPRGLSLALAIAALAAAYVIHEIWMRNNPYGALSGPAESYSPSWLPIDLFLMLMMAPLPWSLLFVFGRPAAFGYMTAIGLVLAVALNHVMLIGPAIYGIPVLLFSLYLRKNA